jgi:hypothetical protein
MIKQLKFMDWMVPLIMSGKKNSTWRLFDDKDLKTGDLVDFIERPSLKTFARARLIDVQEKPFSQLTDKDKQGHEEFNSDEEMYRTYKKYYHQRVGPEKKVKIIKFRIIPDQRKNYA